MSRLTLWTYSSPDTPHPGLWFRDVYVFLLTRINLWFSFDAIKFHQRRSLVFSSRPSLSHPLMTRSSIRNVIVDLNTMCVYVYISYISCILYPYIYYLYNTDYTVRWMFDILEMNIIGEGLYDIHTVLYEDLDTEMTRSQYESCILGYGCS